MAASWQGSLTKGYALSLCIPFYCSVFVASYGNAKEGFYYNITKSAGITHYSFSKTPTGYTVTMAYGSEFTKMRTAPQTSITDCCWFLWAFWLWVVSSMAATRDISTNRIRNGCMSKRKRNSPLGWRKSPCSGGARQTIHERSTAAGCFQSCSHRRLPLCSQGGRCDPLQWQYGLPHVGYLALDI